MLKKFLIVCMCIMAVIAVFGLNDRMNYEGFQTAIEFIQGDSSLILSDITSIEVLAFCIENFDSQARITIDAVEQVDGSSWGIQYSLHRDDDTDIYRFWYGLSEESAVKLSKLLQPLTWGFGSYTGLFTDVIGALNAVVFFLGSLVTIILVLIAILFDTVSSVFSVIHAFLYLIGLSRL